MRSCFREERSNLVDQKRIQTNKAGLVSFAKHMAFTFFSDGKSIVFERNHDTRITPYFEITTQAGLIIHVRSGVHGESNRGNVRIEYETKEGRSSFELPSVVDGDFVSYQFPKGVKVHDLRYRLWESIKSFD